MKNTPYSTLAAAQTFLLESGWKPFFASKEVYWIPMTPRRASVGRRGDAYIIKSWMK